MFFFENIRLAFSSLRSNKMRAILTMLGIIIGISAVITITTLGSSLKKTLANSFNELGGKTLGIRYQFKYEPDENGDYPDYVPITKEECIDLDMIKELNEKYPGKYLVSLSNFCGDSSIKNKKGQMFPASLAGATEGYLKEDNVFKIIQGRCFNDADSDGQKHSAIVSDIFVKQYFGSEKANAIGCDINIDVKDVCNMDVTIIGVYKYPKLLEKQFQPGTGLMDRETIIFIPYGTSQKIKRVDETADYGFQFMLSSPSYDRKQAKAELKSFFDEKYKTNRRWGVEVTDPMDELTSVTKILNIVTLVISIIAAISLIVGGIGVMNIMLVSITERTREIGVRKALGAKNSYIRTQFIVESVILCLIGGIIGVLLGMFNGFLIGKIAAFALSQMPEYEELVSLTIQPSLVAIIIALAFSMLIGVFFGSYPAGKAAKLDPIEALRYE
ncbi:ABC transporter permease [Ruminococcus flavefaciens]|uniref:ABC transporter permease n=2 Tax=Ruminococcus flavefaciens TaxID=1265 RepID=W7UZD5_RUMFL|nr:ABC transporter permease [Ruminococcus flavefaciens]EWM53812.1 hypothetical protein RF007C_08850 [Ruminococcus flavefaciens 007c]